MCVHGLCLHLASLKHDHDVPQIFHDVFAAGLIQLFICASLIERQNSKNW